MSVTLKILVIFFSGLITSVLYAQTHTETHYVTQTGNGIKTGRALSNAWSLSDFHNSNNWSANNALDSKIGPGDVVFFSGLFSDRVVVTMGGTASRSVTLDGYEAGECDPIVSVCTGSALLGRGMSVGDGTAGPNNVTVQDFRMTTPTELLNAFHARGASNNYIEHFIFRRNYLYEAGDRIAQFQYVKYSIIDGNKFYGCGHASIELDFITQTAVSLVKVENSVFSNNEAAHDGTEIKRTSGGNSELVALHGTSNLLIEYNNLHSSPGQTCLRPKEAFGGVSNTVIRFNKIHGGNTHNVNINTDSATPHYNHYIYGNYIYNSNWVGLVIGNYINNVYVWSNIITDNGRAGFTVYGTSNNIHFYNNTVVGNNTSGNTEHARGGIVLSGGQNFFIRNNILSNNRPGGEGGRYNQVGNWQTINELEHNTYHHSLNAPTIYHNGGYQTLATMQTTYSYEKKSPAGVIRDPLLDRYYRLTPNSPEGNAGTTITGSFSVNISGGDAWFEAQTGYSTINFGYDDSLCPINTDWTSNPPTVATVKQNEYGNGWSRGAYVFKSYPSVQNPLPVPKNLKIITAQ